MTSKYYSIPDPAPRVSRGSGAQKSALPDMPAFTINLCQTWFQHHAKDRRSFPAGLRVGSLGPITDSESLSSE